MPCLRLGEDDGCVRITGQLSPEEFWARDAELEQQIRASSTFLPYRGVDGWSGLQMIGDWQWENDRLVIAGLAHGAPQGTGPRLHVVTTVRDPRSVAASLRSASAAAKRGESDAAHQRRVLEADPDEEVTIPVDGAGVRLDLWHTEDQDRWWAAGHHDGHGLVLEAHLVPTTEVGLHRVHDLEPYLDGRRTHLRELRGGT